MPLYYKSAIDKAEDEIRLNPASYSVIGFIRQRGNIVVAENVVTYDEAEKIALDHMVNTPRVRAMLIYAISSDGHHSLAATINEQGTITKIKPNVIEKKRYLRDDTLLVKGT